MEQSLVQRLSGLSSLHHSRHPFLSLQRPGAGPPSHQDKQDLIRVSESKDDNDEDDKGEYILEGGFSMNYI